MAKPQNPVAAIKKKWNLLPKKAKTIYKMTAVIVVLAIYGVHKLTGSSEDIVPAAATMPAADLSAKAGTEVNPDTLGEEHRKQIAEAESNRLKEAKGKGGSYLPKSSSIEVINSDINWDEPVAKPESGTTGTPEKTPPPTPKPSPSSKNEGRHNAYNQENEGDDELQAVTQEQRNALIQSRAAVIGAMFEQNFETQVSGLMYVGSWVGRQQDASQAHDANTQTKGGGNTSARVDEVIAPTSDTFTLTPGDIILVKIDNYIDSDESSNFVRMTVIDGLGIEGNIIIGSYAVNGESLNIKTHTLSNNINTNKQSINLKGVVVTTDGKISSSIKTDSTSHGFYRWGLLVLSAALSGAGEVFLDRPTEVIYDESGRIIERNEKDSKDILLGVAKGIGDRTADIAAKEFYTQPTVWYDPEDGDILGVMITEPVNIPWAPVIPASSIY